MVDAVTLGALQRLKYSAFSFSPPLTANSGSVQSGATLCPAVVNTFNTVAGAGYSGVLPAATAGRIVYVINAGANSLNLFPNGTDQIDALGASNAFSLVNGGIIQLTATSTGQWYSDAPAAGEFVTLTGTQTLTNKTLTAPALNTPTLTDAINKDTKSGALTTFASTTSLAAITGLAVALTTSGTYAVQASLPVTTGATPGVAVALAASNSLTAISTTYTAKIYSATGVDAVNTTTLGSGVGVATNAILVELSGLISVNTGGTLILQGSQQASNATTCSFLAGSSLSVTRIS